MFKLSHGEAGFPNEAGASIHHRSPLALIAPPSVIGLTFSMAVPATTEAHAATVSPNAPHFGSLAPPTAIGEGGFCSGLFITHLLLLGNQTAHFHVLSSAWCTVVSPLNDVERISRVRIELKMNSTPLCQTAFSDGNPHAAEKQASLAR
ncbi:hypothetical protein [Enorma massiliensis]|uniref:hypothetical protein n=1 Tax=Enorma massiliensis TaxID=1472761 RepID=UPI003AEFCB6D